MKVARWNIRRAQHELRVARKMARTIERLGIPMPPAPKTKREMYIRLASVWAVLGVAFVALYLAFNSN